ncbi:helix-turn-helix transcriptional regulator [Methanofollis fontis]|nr:transcriptional regulator FilR1 domain-containing protein [Methanofollis fontis]
MASNNTVREYGTPHLRLFKRCHPGIQSFFRSTLGIKILLLLRDGPLSPHRLCTAAGNTMPAVVSKLNIFVNEGLIERCQDQYALSNAARIITPHLIDVIAAVRSEENHVPGTGRETLEKKSSQHLIDRFIENQKAIRTVFRSGIVAGILLELNEGQKNRPRLHRVSGCTSNALTPRIRWLERMGWVTERRHTYRLTQTGSGVAATMEEFVVTFATATRHGDFWNTHSLERFPGFALHTIGDLVEAEIISDEPTSFFLNYERYLDLLADADYIHGFTSMANPGFADAIGARVMAGVPVEIVVSPDLAYHLHQEPYQEKVASLYRFRNLQFRVTELPLPMGLTVTERCLSSKLFLRDEMVFDTQNGLVCSSPEAHAWGERLFEYYKRHSIPMQEYILSKAFEHENSELKAPDTPEDGGEVPEAHTPLPAE